MDIIGMHTYGGGFALGVKRAGGNILGSVETWKEAMPFAKLVGIPLMQSADYARADVVIGNPPCSRFSAMSYSSFEEKDRTNIDEFCDLTAVLDLGKEKRATVIWWENGPIACTKGKDIIVEAHKRTGARTTLVLKFDLPWAGVPQRRPRTHVIHFINEVNILGLDGGNGVEIRTIKQWMVDELQGLPTPPVSYTRYYSMEDPMSTIAYHNSIGGFKAMKPRAVCENQRWSSSLVSGRQHAWSIENRWWSIAEYATIQRYPNALDYEGLLRVPWHRVTTYMSKSVSPCASEWVYTNIVYPGIVYGTLTGDVKVQEYAENIKFAKLVVPGQSKEIWNVNHI